MEGAINTSGCSQVQYVTDINDLSELKDGQAFVFTHEFQNLLGSGKTEAIKYGIRAKDGLFDLITVFFSQSGDCPASQSCETLKSGLSYNVAANLPEAYDKLSALLSSPEEGVTDGSDSDYAIQAIVAMGKSQGGLLEAGEPLTEDTNRKVMFLERCKRHILARLDRSCSDTAVEQQAQ